MKYVYLIRSIPHPDQRYVGITDDIDKRIQHHNDGGSKHTNKYKPWELMTCIAFPDSSKTFSFEKYLKTGSGRAFANRRLW